MLKHVTTKVKCRSSGNSALWLAVMEEKIVHESAMKFATTKSNAVASLLRWSRGEENTLLSCIFGRVAELNWMWKEAMDEFNNQYLNYRRHFKKIFQQEKEVEEQRKVLMALHPKVIKARKQVDGAMKRGDVARLPALENELEMLSVQYDSLQESVLSAINRVELEKIADVRAALTEQAGAFVELAEKCGVIFKAQQSMMELIPESVDLSFLKEDHQNLRKNLCTILNTTGEKLQLTPPLDGGIDSHQSLQLFVSPVTTNYRNRSESLNEHGPSHLHRVSRHILPTNPDKGNIGPPIPPRSHISLESGESTYVIVDKTSFKRPMARLVGDTSGEYVSIVSNQEDQVGLSRSYSDSQILYTRSSTIKSMAGRQNSSKTKPPRPPAPRKNSTASSISSQYSCPMFRELTPSPSPTLPPEDPPYQTPIDALQLPYFSTQMNTELQGEVVRTVSDCPVRLVRVRGSSRRKHQPVKRVSVHSPPPLLKSLSMDHLDALNDSDDDYEEIYSNPYDIIDTAAAGRKPIHVTARLSTSSANCRPPSRQSTTSQNSTPHAHSNLEKSHSVDCLDTIELSDNPTTTSALLQRRRLKNRHASLDDSVKRLRAKNKGITKNTNMLRKTSMEIQTYPESPQHLKGVGSQENLFFSESSPPTSATTTILEESTDSVFSKKKTSINGIGTPPTKTKNHKKKILNTKPSRSGLTNLFKKKPKDT